MKVWKMLGLSMIRASMASSTNTLRSMRERLGNSTLSLVDSGSKSLQVM